MTTPSSPHPSDRCLWIYNVYTHTYRGEYIGRVCVCDIFYECGTVYMCIISSINCVRLQFSVLSVLFTGCGCHLFWVHHCVCDPMLMWHPSSVVCVCTIFCKCGTPSVCVCVIHHLMYFVCNQVCYSCLYVYGLCVSECGIWCVWTISCECGILGVCVWPIILCILCVIR